MICHCDICGSTFNGAVIRSKYEIPCKCPDCGKRTAAKHVPSVRAATDEEIVEHKKFLKSEINKICRYQHSDKPLGT